MTSPNFKILNLWFCLKPSTCFPLIKSFVVSWVIAWLHDLPIRSDALADRILVDFWILSTGMNLYSRAFEAHFCISVQVLIWTSVFFFYCWWVGASGGMVFNFLLSVFFEWWIVISLTCFGVLQLSHCVCHNICCFFLSQHVWCMHNSTYRILSLFSALEWLAFFL